MEGVKGAHDGPGVKRYAPRNHLNVTAGLMRTGASDNVRRGQGHHKPPAVGVDVDAIWRLRPTIRVRSQGAFDGTENLRLGAPPGVELS